MHPILFAIFLGEHLTLFSRWAEENGTLVGAITLASLAAGGGLAHLGRHRLGRVFALVRSNATLVVLASAPLAAFALLLMNKYLTFVSAMATTVGVLVALTRASV